MERSGGPSNSGGSGGAKIIESKPLPVSQDKKKQQKQQKQLILLAVLVCIFLYVVYANILAPKKKAGSVPNKNTQAAQPTSYPSSVIDLSESEKESVSALDALFTEDDKWDRNPFTLGGEEGEEEVTDGALRLDGIVFDGNDSYAIISKKIVKKGDRVADNVVKEIRENEVLLKTDDGQFIELRT